MSKQKRQHKFFDNHTIPGVIALMFAGRFPLGPVPLSSIGASLMAGISEEIAFRELPISYLARQWREEKFLPVMVLIPGISFGLVHLTNAAFGGRLFDTVMQAILSIFFGIFFSIQGGYPRTDRQGAGVWEYQISCECCHC